MIRLILIFTTFFILDNLLVIFLPIQPLVGQYFIIPNAFLCCLCLFTFYDRGVKYDHGIKSVDYHGNKAFVFAFIFGVLYDVFYLGSFGIHTCLFIIIVFLLRKFLVPSIPINLLSMIALTSGIIIFEESVVFFFATTILNLNYNFTQFIQYALFPSLFFNAIFMIFAYPILTRQFKNLLKD